MRVCLFGWFGFKNLGDDLLLSVMLEQISNTVSSIEVGLKDRSYLAPLLKTYPKVRATPRSIKSLFVAALRNDCLIIGPGGLFPHPNLLKVFVFFIITLWWKLLGKHVVWFCFGASRRQDSFSAVLWRGIARLSDLFISRDDNVFVGSKIHASATCYVATDAIFTVASSDVIARPNRAAVCLANLFTDGETGYGVFLDSCVQTVRHINEKGLEVDLLSFTAGADERLNIDIALHVPGCHVLSYEQTLKTVRGGLRYRLVVGMRFHAVVLGLLGVSTVVPIAYADKTEALARQAGIEDKLTFFCKGGDSSYFGRDIPLDAEKVSAAVDAALVTEGDDLRMKAVIKDKRRIAMEAFVLLKSFIGGG